METSALTLWHLVADHVTIPHVIAMDLPFHIKYSGLISFIHSFIYFRRARCMIYVFTGMLILETAYSLQRSCIHAAWTRSMSIDKVIGVCNLLIWLVK